MATRPTAICSIGRVRYAQPRQGFRSGIEPVLLAAAIPARPGERVLEGGSGAGAALLCLAARVPGVRGLGIEQDPALVPLARRNAAGEWSPGLEFIAADIASLPALGVFDHACANPPYHATAARHRRTLRDGPPSRRPRAAGGMGRRAGSARCGHGAR